MNCKIVGYDFKALEVLLEPGDTFYCEKGAIVYHEDGIEKNVKVLDKGLAGLLKRKLSGESVFLVELYNRASSPKKLLVAGKVGMLPVDLSQFGGEIICRAGYYIASNKNVDVDFSINLSSLISNAMLLLQKTSGTGTVFLDSFGTSVCLDVQAGTSVYVDEKHFLCINASAINQLHSTFSGRGLLAGEGLSMYQISGPAKAYITTQQTFTNLINKIL